jgi:DNA topoisomerase-1
MSAAKKTTSKAKAPSKAATKKKAKPRGRSLVIVESPAKARTINKYLGKEYVVKASMGHVRDLPKGKFGIDLEDQVVPEYQAIRGKTKVISELKKLAKSAPLVYLAPDLDREGEAIAWHLVEALEIPDEKIRRVVFNEITKKAILEAFEEPGELDMHKVDAQQARRVLDRIMGYKLSPLLWEKIAKGLSAGRVQSVAVRLIVEREQEIRSFESVEYWRVHAHLEESGQPFTAELKRVAGKTLDRNLAPDVAVRVVDALKGQELELSELEEKPKSRRATAAFTTSQLQQKASTMLRFSAKKTMAIAQQLYEGVSLGSEGSVGLITYMRTDSVRVSNDAIAQARDLIGKDYGSDYLPAKPNIYKAGKRAQEAHEAVRPTDCSLRPDDIAKFLSTDQLKLYRLIWNKFIASQMTPARSLVTTATFRHAAEGGLDFVAQGTVEVFDGHLRVFSQDRGEKTKEAKEAKQKAEEGAEATDAAAAKSDVLPTGLKQGAQYTPREIEKTQHFTQPPPRYSEATLVKEMEKRGIGRPSTYATIISTIQDRGYVVLEQRRFAATELGEIVTEQLVGQFGNIINTEFTSGMEESLDRVESGDRAWDDVVLGFYELFTQDLERAKTGMRNLKTDPELTDRKCEKCGSPMQVLYNKRGKFLGCSNYPDCKNTMPVDGPRPKAEVIETDYVCDKCEKPMVIRDGRRGRFLACTGFPKCKNTASVDENNKIVVPKKTGIDCDKCGSEMIIKGSRRGPFLACSAFPKCRNAKPLPDELREAPKETGETCEQCGEPMVIKTTRWGKEFLACSGYPKCKNARDLEPKETAPASEGEAS